MAKPKRDDMFSSSGNFGEKIIKKTVSLRIDGQIYHLKEGEKLPENIDKSFYMSLENDGVI